MANTLMTLAAALVLACGLFIGGAYFGRKNPKFLTAIDNGWQRLAGYFKRKG